VRGDGDGGRPHAAARAQNQDVLAGTEARPRHERPPGGLKDEGRGRHGLRRRPGRHAQDVALVDGDELGARISAVRAAAGDTLLLGRSRRAGYGGQAPLEWGTPRERELEGRAGLVMADLSPGETFRLLTVSDLLARDPRTGAVDPAAVEDLLLAPDGPLAGRAEVVRRHWAFRPVGGFNRTWGLELPQALTLRAGSVLLLRALEPIALADLLVLEQAGVGERRTEGFGRIAFFGAPEERPTVLPADTGDRELESDFLIDINGMVIDGKLEILFFYRSRDYKKGTMEKLAGFYKSGLIKLIDHCTGKEEKELTVSDLSATQIDDHQLETIFEELEEAFN